MRTRASLVLLILMVASGVCGAEPKSEIQIGSTEMPKGYHLDEERSLSPNEKYGVIYADSEVIDPDVAKNYLVARNPFRILAVTSGYSYYKPGNHRDMAVEWRKDNSAVLVMIGDKWGTIAATLFELEEGKVSKQTDVMELLTAKLMTKFPKTGVEPYNEYMAFVLSEENKFGFSKDGKTLQFDVVANTRPNLAPGKAWEGSFKGVWDVSSAKWVKAEARGRVFENKEQ